jgi:hypothetical protein
MSENVFATDSRGFPRLGQKLGSAQPQSLRNSHEQKNHERKSYEGINHERAHDRGRAALQGRVKPQPPCGSKQRRMRALARRVPRDTEKRSVVILIT